MPEHGGDSQFNFLGADGCPPFLGAVSNSVVTRRAAARRYEDNNSVCWLSATLERHWRHSHAGASLPLS